MAKAVAYQATLQGYDVRYVEADTEFAHYGLASAQEQAEQLKAWIAPDLLVLDDLFLARRIAEAGAELLQAIVHQRYKLRRAIVITSNRVVQDWGKYLGDATMATTILDRLMHRCAMLEFEGKSYRLKEAASRIAVTPVWSPSDCPAWSSLTGHKWGSFWGGHRGFDEMVKVRGEPLSIRLDNGPKFIAHALAEWTQSKGVALSHIQPRTPTQNAYVERPNKTY